MLIKRIFTFDINFSYFHHSICFTFFQNNITAGEANKRFGDMVAINKNDIIVVGCEYGKNVYMFKRNSNSGLWDLSDQVIGKGYYPKLTENLLAIAPDNKKRIAVYKVDALGGIHKPAIYNFTVDKSSLNPYEYFSISISIYFHQRGTELDFKLGRKNSHRREK